MYIQRTRQEKSNMEHQTPASKYLVRTYGPEKGLVMLQTDTMSDKDRKIILSMTKLSASYNAHKDKQVKTIQLDYYPVLSVINNKPSPPPKLVKPLTCICKAFKMNGEKCKSKVKEGAFCARHSKK